MNDRDIQTDVLTTGTGQPTSVRLTHKPSGLVETREGASMLAARLAAFAALWPRIIDWQIAQLPSNPV